MVVVFSLNRESVFKFDSEYYCSRCDTTRPAAAVSW